MDLDIVDSRVVPIGWCHCISQSYPLSACLKFECVKSNYEYIDIENSIMRVITMRRYKTLKFIIHYLLWFQFCSCFALLASCWPTLTQVRGLTPSPSSKSTGRYTSAYIGIPDLKAVLIWPEAVLYPRTIHPRNGSGLYARTWMFQNIILNV